MFCMHGYLWGDIESKQCWEFDGRLLKEIEFSLTQKW